MPDGISVFEQQIQPSWVYRAALERAAEIWTPDQKIWLAPANNFGFEKFEQELGGEFLQQHFPKIEFEVIPTPADFLGYVDTFGNAVLSADFFKKNMLWGDGKIVLVSAKIHARRAAFCFAKAGFQIEKLVLADYSDCPSGERIVGRLFYYRFPFLHRVYEWLARQRDSFS